MPNPKITTHFSLRSERLPGKIPIDLTKKGDAEIVHFYSNYRGWILDYAETLTNGRGISKFTDKEKVGKTPILINNSGFAFLALINAYFDIIGQLCGNDGDQYDCYRQKNGEEFQKATSHKTRNWKDWDNLPNNNDHKPETVRCVWYGLATVLYEARKTKGLDCKKDKEWAIFCNSFYHQTRNPIAHLTFPGNLLITRELKDENGHDVPLWQLVGTKKVICLNVILWFETISQHFDKYAYRIRFPQSDDDKELRNRFMIRFTKLAQ